MPSKLLSTVTPELVTDEPMTTPSAPPSRYWAAPSGTPAAVVRRTVTCMKSVSPAVVARLPPSASSTSPTEKPGTSVVPVSTTVPEPAATVGASLTGTMSIATSRLGALFGWLPAPVSPPMPAAPSEKLMVNVTSPGDAPLVSWLRLAAP
ncbi:Uncharacterised protein [Xylophilus ampelinus]|nr:Uncharacterised protein [Xylophilus ampelinus]